MQFDLSHKLFEIIKNVSAQQNVEIYVVGGYVRDLILKRENKDIDFVVVGNGVDTAVEVAKAISPNIEVTQYKNYGTAMFVTAILT